MKKLLITAVAAVFALGLVSCAGVNVKLESCNTACEVAQKKCIDMSKDKNGKVIEWKKAACDSTAEKCKKECAKKYGVK
jgi:hypothetical protein